MKPGLMTQEHFKGLLGDRTIYLYAVNLEGIGYMRRFQHLGFKVGGFIDSRKFPNDQKHGVPIFHPDLFFTRDDRNVMVVICTKHQPTRLAAMKRCEEFGLERGRSYLGFTDLCDYMPTVETIGLCNLRCTTCNMGLPGANKNGGIMYADTYRKVIAKLGQDLPFLSSIYLYLWGEPLINPDQAEIIRITHEHGVACEISTNLINIKRLEEVIKAQPDTIVMPCAGVGDNFAKGRTGGTWDVYRANLYTLREYLSKYSPETTARITYHAYKNNLEEDYDIVKGIAKELGFQFHPVLAQVFPEPVVKNVLFDEPIPPMIKKASDEILYYTIEEQLEYAYESREKFCSYIKAFPTVRWDTSVAHCSNLMEPVLTKSYLEADFDAILAERDRNEFCNKCQAKGLHRFFDVVTQIVDKDGVRSVTRR